MSKPAAADCEGMPSHPGAPKRASATQHGTNSFVRGKGKGKKSRKRVKK